ncbi:MAG: MgtC/SapB family protein [Clostridia bacterium]|nr:MgtC/SapB family protein [Clostridia bacterium]
MTELILSTLEYFLRIILAGICGGIIGYERKNRGKGAGIRTHVIVAIASALMMIISKYGFNDLAFGEDFRLDPSRVASQIVSGVGFLGAGMIFIQKQAVKGLTTAAGIWATSGIGMAIGSGLYVIGITTSLVIVVVQLITHKHWQLFHTPNEEVFNITIEDSEEALTYLKNYMSFAGIHITGLSIKKKSDFEIDIEVTAILPIDFDMTQLLDYDRKYISSLKV